MKGSASIITSYTTLGYDTFCAEIGLKLNENGIVINDLKGCHS